MILSKAHRKTTIQYRIGLDQLEYDKLQRYWGQADIAFYRSIASKIIEPESTVAGHGQLCFEIARDDESLCQLDADILFTYVRGVISR